MKKHLLAAAVALVPHVCAAQTIAWSNEPGSVAVARDLEDAVYTARWDFNPAGDIHVAKRDAAGMLLWESHFDNQDANRHEVATFIATDGEGNALVSGTIRSGISNPVNAASVLMKFSPDGQLLWRNVYGANFDGSSTRRVVMDGAGRAHVVGLGVCPAGLMGTVRQYGADGSLGWVWCDDIGIGAPTMIKRTPDGQFVIASRGITGSAQGFARIDSAGHTVWSLAGIVSPAGGDIAGDAAGNSYIVHAAPNGGPGSQLRKLSPTGEVLWERAHPMSAFRVELGADGAPVISGFPNSGSAGAAFAKFDPEGTLLWTNASSGPNLLMHSAMQIDADGSAYLSGSTLVEMGVAKVYADGSTAWFMLLPGGATSDMVLGSQGQVYVSGGIYTARIDQVPVAVVFSQGFEP